MKIKSAIVVASGGLDSTVTLAYAVQKGYDTAALHVNYGQRTEKRELQAFHEVTEHFGITKKMVVDIGYLREIGGSSLTDSSQSVEEGGITEGVIPSTYVPFRNAHILSIAVSWGEVLGAEAIFIGAVEVDGSGYPDCTGIFYERFNALLDVALKPENKIQVQTPLLQLSKAEIVALGVKLNAPLHLSWSCYQSEDEACGVCDSCLLRLKGFEAKGIKDPIRYRRGI